MAKTNPIGVRFREDVLEKLRIDHGVDSPQKSLIFLERFYVTHSELAKNVTQVLRAATFDPKLLEELSELKKTIAEIKSEKIPPGRDTSMGRPFWQKDQEKRIREVEFKIMSKIP